MNLLCTLKELFAAISSSLDAIEEDVVSASVNCPPYGLLEVLKTESITRDNVAQIESIAHRAAELLMPIVGSAAPEGCLPWNKTDENWTRLPSGLQNMLKSLAISQDDSNLRKTSQLVLIC